MEGRRVGQEEVDLCWKSGVTFHGFGVPFNADAVVWNVEKVLKQMRFALRRQSCGLRLLPHADAGFREARSTT